MPAELRLRGHGFAGPSPAAVAGVTVAANVEGAAPIPTPPGRPFIKRPRLTRLLDEVEARVIMLVAPAGYGKTTLAREWLEGRDGPHGWYSGSAASADVAALSVGIAAAATSVLPGAGDRLVTRLRVTNAPESEVDVLAELLAEDLAPWPDDAWLCVDDYHFTRRSTASEYFVERLLALSPVRLLIATRARPTWATTRRILYGELVEIGTNALAMTHDEAEEVLAERGPARLPGLLALTDGWPAAIGLAAVIPKFEVPEEELPSPLYDYIAEELYQSADSDLQLRLCQLAVAPNPTVDLLEHLFGSDAPSVLADGVRLGFLTPRSDGGVDLHPLLRAFLEGKLREQGEPFIADLVTRVGHFLTTRRRWDDVFAVASRHRRADVFVDLLEASREEILAAGRLTTLSEWLSSPLASYNDPTIDVARSELAFREARYPEAEAFAREVSDNLSEDNPLLGAALLAGGRAAYFRERQEDAIRCFREARRVATSANVLRDAIRGELTAMLELDHSGTHELLADLAAVVPDDADSRLALHNSRLFVATRHANIIDAVVTAEDALHLLPKTRDPLTRSSFLQMLSNAMVLCARYQDSLELVTKELAEAEQYRLTFVRPQALAVKACAELGLRRFRAALGTVRRLHADAVAHDDVHSLMNATAIQLRIRIAQGAFDQAYSESRLAWHRLPSKGMHGEYLACQALALACGGHAGKAAEHADRAEAITSQPETRVLGACTRAILALTQGQEDDARVRLVADLVRETGNLDGLVTAYRGFPALLRSVASHLGETLSVPLYEARDGRIARAMGLDIPPPAPTVERMQLSTRENEVHNLIRQGMTNREIAQALFISESTVKVHVGKVLRKLNVRSRTEAALLPGNTT